MIDIRPATADDLPRILARVFIGNEHVDMAAA